VAAADQANRYGFDSALRLAERGIELAARNEAHCGLLLLRGDLLLDSAVHWNPTHPIGLRSAWPSTTHSAAKPGWASPQPIA